MTTLKTHFAYGLNLRGYRKVLSVCGMILPWNRFAKHGEPTTCGNCRRLVPLSKTLVLPRGKSS